mmetsp:Transcript_4596/g.20591  ORF Transcript_4596/g.20591 Transcript_4596/m.20591 type:complete len:328 (-) Transcript_4596:1894-2877(-)
MGAGVALRSTSGLLKRGRRGVSIYMETTTAISLDSRCLSRPMGRASPSVLLTTLFECTSGKQTQSGSASVRTSRPNLQVMQLALPSQWQVTVVASPSARPRVTPTERTPDMCGYMSWQSGTQLRLRQACNLPPHLLHLFRLPRRVLLHHRPLRSNGIRWVQISMAIPATIMAGRSLCLGMACGWQSEHRSMTKMVQAAPKKTMDAFECIDGCRSNGSSSEVISLGRSTTRLDLRCLCPKTARDSPLGWPRKSQKARAKFRYTIMTTTAVIGTNSATLSSARKTRICLVPPSQYLVRAHALLSVPHTMIPVAWKNKVRDTFACLSGMR